MDLPGTLRCGQDFFHSQRLNSQSNLSAVDAVSIADEIAGRLSIGERLHDLLRPATATVVCGDPASDGRVAGSADHRGVSLDISAGLLGAGQ